MNPILVVIVVLLAVLLLGLFLWSRKLKSQLDGLIEASERERQQFVAETQRINAEAEESIKVAEAAVDQQLTAIQAESGLLRQHYEGEARAIQAAAEAQLSKVLEELNGLRRFALLRDAEVEVKRQMEEAVLEATALRQEAQLLLERARQNGEEELAKATQRAKESLSNADRMLDRATLEAGRLVAEAEKRAEDTAGDAYIALRDKSTLDAAVTALWNVANGYGDRYVVPTRSVLDELAADFGHTEAGIALKSARDRTRRMVEQGQASACNYVEEDRRARANRFVVDAFNGRVDAILSRVRHDNYGTLVQEINDAFSLVNLNGVAFRDARVLPAYLDARLAELKWGVVVQELKLKEREEQRRIKEQMREEEKARREYERAMQQAQREEDIIKQAMEKTRLESELVTADQRAKFDEQIAILNQRLAEAEARNQRALSMAQQTRKGNIYIISNIGSFGEEVFKIGMTRRLEPLDRVRELSDASVPFEFDVHAIIPCDDAPALENLLHNEFDDMRVNRVNYRKEFFRIPLEKVREFLLDHAVEASFTMVAEAHEYRETVALNKMTPEEREKYRLRLEEGGDADLE